MYVTVSLKIEREATARLTQMDRQIQEAGRAARPAARPATIRQQEESQQTCPEGGSAQQRAHGTKRQVVLTRFGRGEVSHRRELKRFLRKYSPCPRRLGNLFRGQGHRIAELVQAMDMVAFDARGIELVKVIGA